jgi:hypothetical protein
VWQSVPAALLAHQACKWPTPVVQCKILNLNLRTRGGCIRSVPYDHTPNMRFIDKCNLTLTEIRLNCQEQNSDEKTTKGLIPLRLKVRLI